MKKAILLLALFPFLHKTVYPVEYVSCKTGEIIVKHEDETLEISLFNTKITSEKGWNQACSLISEAKQLRIEMDPSSKIEEPMPVYLFADGQLVQEEIIKKEAAYPMIHNPEYTYEKRLEAALDTTKTMAGTKTVKSTHKPAFVAPLYLAGVLFLWGAMLVYMLHQHRKKRRHKIKKTTVQ